MPKATKQATESLDDVKRVREERYFARAEARLIERLRARREAEERAAHAPPLGLCPRCGTALLVEERDGVAIDSCASCGGIWLDRGELETIAKREGGGWMRRLLG